MPRSRGGESTTSAFTSYIARDDLHTAISKYRASSCRDAYYLLTEGHCWNGFTWRLKVGGGGGEGACECVRARVCVRV